MSEEAGFPIRIDLGILGNKTFGGITEVEKWINEEKRYWNWIEEFKRHSKLNDHLVQIRSTIHRCYNEFNSTLNIIKEGSKHPEYKQRIKSLGSQIQSQLLGSNVFLSDSSIAQYIDQIKEKNGLLAICTTNSFLGLRVDNNLFESIEGAFLAIAFKYGLKDRAENESKALESLRKEWNGLVGEEKELLSNSKDEFEDFKNKYSSQMNEWNDKFKVFSEKSDQQFKELVESSKSILHDVERTYDERLALQASTRYWKTKANIHSKSVKRLIIYCIFSAISIISILALISYFIIGPTKELKEIQLWKFGLLLLAITFGIWLFRILVRLLLSNIHLSTEAIERRTMILTYLALLRKGHGPTEEQRELILQILFRPSSTGIVKDDALPPLAAHWLKQITSS